MPILFGMLVAFTNYDAQHIPPNNLFTWVGFENFRVIFTLNEQGGLPFGTTFFRVFSWTLIWAFASTFTVFFGGFLQAVILANNRVVFRKAWRSLLILPWAIPALISQMVFNVMFRDRGWVNQTLMRMGVYDWLFERGMLGRSFAEAGTGMQRLLYFGEENIQWLSNEANPWFVRIFIIVLNIWLGFPFFMALMTGVMTSIDRSLYEAAAIDGATGYQQFRFITMPLVLFATSPLLIMTFAGNFNNFGVIYFITQGGPGGDFTTAFAGQTDILISWIYKLTTDQNVRWYSMASVFSLLIFLIIGTISAWNFTRTRAFKEEM
jgi:arabinogalactan oligomer/maltooligosaccharide transport system permease protein